GGQDFLDPAPEKRRRPLCRRLQPAELEPRERDVALPADGIEAEVGQEIGRKDRAVDQEALVGTLALGIAVRERLDRLRLAVASLADDRQEEALDRPRRG